ncbi:MAG TPA: hemerythrin domain-containing protein [Xanthobacteraceae bacterium]|nr:hemerythrin domain-containing protein [Xanthobacteraceae bacterium]
MIGSAIHPLLGPKHVLGHALIDADHAAIADAWLRAVSCEPIQFPFLIARLRKLMRVHFDNEARLMQSAGGALCECHLNEHRALLGLCDRAAARGHDEWPRAQSLLRSRLPKMVRSHIARMDQIAVLFINASGKACDCGVSF